MRRHESQSDGLGFQSISSVTGTNGFAGGSDRAGPDCAEIETEIPTATKTAALRRPNRVMEADTSVCAGEESTKDAADLRRAQKNSPDPVIDNMA